MKDDPIKQVETDVMHEQKHRDGIPQIAMGLFLMFIAVLMQQGRGSFLGIFIVFIPLVINILRKQFTYPRVGYAELHDKAAFRKQGLWLVAGLLLSGLAVMLAVQNHLLPPSVQVNLHLWALAFIAFIVLALLALNYMRERNSILLFYAGFILLFALAVWLFKLSNDVTHLILFCFGLLNFIYGSTALLVFIRKHPVLPDED